MGRNLCEQREEDGRLLNCFIAELLGGNLGKRVGEPVFLFGDLKFIKVVDNSYLLKSKYLIKLIL